jgi:hypothetical protein
MSTSYVIPGATSEQVLSVLQTDDNMVVINDDDHYVIEMPIDLNYSLQKRMALARATEQPGDDIQQGGNKASIFLIKSEDGTEDFCWFVGFATSIRHPELVLDRIVELLDAHGIESSWMSEYDEGFGDYMDGSDEFTDGEEFD